MVFRIALKTYWKAPLHCLSVFQRRRRTHGTASEFLIKDLLVMDRLLDYSDHLVFRSLRFCLIVWVVNWTIIMDQPNLGWILEFVALMVMCHPVRAVDLLEDRILPVLRRNRTCLRILGAARDAIGGAMTRVSR
jgi:hypothetical protein